MNIFQCTFILGKKNGCQRLAETWDSDGPEWSCQQGGVVARHLSKDSSQSLGDPVRVRPFSLSLCFAWVSCGVGHTICPGIQTKASDVNDSSQDTRETEREFQEDSSSLFSSSSFLFSMWLLLDNANDEDDHDDDDHDEEVLWFSGANTFGTKRWTRVIYGVRELIYGICISLTSMLKDEITADRTMSTKDLWGFLSWAWPLARTRVRCLPKPINRVLLCKKKKKKKNKHEEGESESGARAASSHLHGAVWRFVDRERDDEDDDRHGARDQVRAASQAH